MNSCDENDDGCCLHDQVESGDQVCCHCGLIYLARSDGPHGEFAPKAEEKARAEEREACAQLVEVIEAECDSKGLAGVYYGLPSAIRARGQAAPPKPDATALALEALKAVRNTDDHADAEVRALVRAAIAALEAAR